MFNHEKSVACAFSLLLKPSNLGLFGKLVSFGAVFQAFCLIFKLELQFLRFLSSKFNLNKVMIWFWFCLQK
ncbi:hypothetical protein CGH15_22610 [Vibrio parahaemolyticus]|nr:hypothetical protein CGH15_22610 [Vibrio parahaemolyticus]